MSIIKCGDKTFEEAFKEMDNVISAGFEIAKSVCLENRELLDKVKIKIKATIYMHSLGKIVIGSQCLD